MRAYCGKCGGTFDGQMLCPQCGIQLATELDATIALPANPTDGGESPDGPSSLRRLTLGTFLVGGLYLGVRHLATAVSLRFGGGSDLDLVTVVGVLALAVAAAALLAGTASRRAEAIGLLLGLGAAGVFLGHDRTGAQMVPPEWLTGVPILLGLAGVSGGFAGRLVFPPAPKLPVFGPLGTRVIPGPRPTRAPMAWARVVAGAILVVSFGLQSESVRHWLGVALSGHGHSFGAGRLVTWQISLLGALFGGVLAGANTRAGVRQGFAAGVLAAAGVVAGVSAIGSAKYQMVDFWIDQLGRKEAGPDVFAVLGGTVWLVTVLGGWLGSQLFPPKRA